MALKINFIRKVRIYAIITGIFVKILEESHAND